MAEFEDLAITGELIVALPEENRWFIIVEKPYYEKYPTEKDPSGEEKRKLALKVKLPTGQTGTYYPNKTSARRIATLTKQTDMDKWTGQAFVWGEITKQKVAGQSKDVLYITDFHKKIDVSTEKVQ